MLESNHFQGDSSDSALSHHPVADYFTVNVRHTGVYSSLRWLVLIKQCIGRVFKYWECLSALCFSLSALTR